MDVVNRKGVVGIRNACRSIGSMYIQEDTRHLLIHNSRRDIVYIMPHLLDRHFVDNVTSCNSHFHGLQLNTTTNYSSAFSVRSVFHKVIDKNMKSITW